MDNFSNDNKIEYSVDNLEFLQKIGEGTYGTVYKAFYKIKEEKKIVAVKVMKTSFENEVIDPSTLREITLLKNLNHTNVIKLIDVILKDNIFIIMEYMDLNLKEFIEKNKKLKKNLLKNILYQILKGVEYLHINLIIHRDLKPKNILISNDGSLVKIGDFGLARKLGLIQKTYTQNVGTISYSAPEILLGFNDYNQAIDIWAIGCIFYELNYSKKLFPGKNINEQLKYIEDKLGTPDNSLWPNIENTEKYKQIYKSHKKLVTDIYFKEINHRASDLLKKMLIYNPKNRISAKTALLHVSLKNIIKILGLFY